MIVVTLLEPLRQVCEPLTSCMLCNIRSRLRAHVGMILFTVLVHLDRAQFERCQHALSLGDVERGKTLPHLNVHGADAIHRLNVLQLRNEETLHRVARCEGVALCVASRGPRCDARDVRTPQEAANDQRNAKRNDTDEVAARDGHRSFHFNFIN